MGLTSMPTITEREINARLQDLYRLRAQRINDFWRLCQDLPQDAMIQCDGSQVKRDVWLLAQKVTSKKRHLTLDPPLLQVVTEKVREVFVREGLEDLERHQWCDPLLVGVFSIDEKMVQVHRFSMGPFYHQEGDVLSWIEGDDWFLRTVSWTVQGGPDEDELRAYTIGVIDDDDTWHPAGLNGSERDRISRLIDSTQTLAKKGSLKTDRIDTNPFTEFPCDEDAEIARLLAQRNDLYRAGRRSEEAQQALRARLKPFRDRMNVLRAQEQDLAQQRMTIDVEMLEIESLALEEELGVSRGDTVRHKETGAEGVLFIRRNGDASFYVEGDRWSRIDDQIRRGEWEVVQRKTEVPADHSDQNPGNM